MKDFLSGDSLTPGDGVGTRKKVVVPEGVVSSFIGDVGEGVEVGRGVGTGGCVGSVVVPFKVSQMQAGVGISEFVVGTIVGIISSGPSLTGTSSQRVLGEGVGATIGAVGTGGAVGEQVRTEHVGLAVIEGMSASGGVGGAVGAQVSTGHVGLGIKLGEGVSIGGFSGKPSNDGVGDVVNVEGNVVGIDDGMQVEVGGKEGLKKVVGDSVGDSVEEIGKPLNGTE
jgi:hypothetical protein